jgi:cold shock CspA family protein
VVDLGANERGTEEERQPDLRQGEALRESFLGAIAGPVAVPPVADEPAGGAAAPTDSAEEAPPAIEAEAGPSAVPANGSEPVLRPILPFLPPSAPINPIPPSPTGTLSGFVKRRVSDRGFGFIEASDGRDYFFHLTDLTPGLFFEDVVEGTTVEFDVKKEPVDGRAGAAQNVRRRAQSAVEDEAS